MILTQFLAYEKIYFTIVACRWRAYCCQKCSINMISAFLNFACLIFFHSGIHLLIFWVLCLIFIETCLKLTQKCQVFQWLFDNEHFNPLNAELNPICKSLLAELFCRVFKFCACFSKNLNNSRTKRDKFVKQKAFCGEGNRHWSECLKNAISSLLLIGKDKFLNKLVNIRVLLLTFWSRLQQFPWRMNEKMSYKSFFVW